MRLQLTFCQMAGAPLHDSNKDIWTIEFELLFTASNRGPVIFANSRMMPWRHIDRA